MTRLASRLRPAVLATVLAGIVATLLVTGCERFSKDSSVDQTTSGLPAMRTHCIGRFLIDLPSDFEQHLASYAELFYGLDKNFRKVNVEVVRAGGAQPSFDAIVSKRAAELAADEHFSSPSKSMLALQRRIDENTVLIRSYKSPRSLDSYVSEYIAQRGESSARFSSRVYTEGEAAEVVEARILKVVEQTRPVLAFDDAGRGLCFGRLLIDAGQDGELFNLTFRSKSLSDVVIQIDMNSLVAKSDGGLLKRWDGNAGLLNKLDFQSSTLRRGKVAIAGLPSEELLSKGKEKGHEVRSFAAETLLSKPASFAAPLLAISMSMGGQVSGDDYRDASLSEREALALWDAIVRSIRPRPGAA
jgi:Tle cognate immunity protein 4 C-terminal domain